MSLQTHRCLSRRQWLQTGCTGFGSLALSALLGETRPASAAQMAPQAGHLIARAKHVIFLFIHGGPSQHDMLDYKPELNKRSGKTGRNKDQTLLGSRWAFSRHGESGQWFSSLLPHLAEQADRLCVLHGMQTDSSAHPVAVPLLHTGSVQFSRPSLGSWVLYGLGTENQDLPGYITINPTSIFGGPSNYGSAFLPSALQATRIGWDKQSLRDAKLLHLGSHPLPAAVVQRQVGLSQLLNRNLLARRQAVQEVQGVLDSVDLSVRMQQTLPRLMDLAGESPATLAMYGIEQGTADNFARQCLLARRFVEAGVRFVQLSHHGWDHHRNLGTHLEKRCAEIDQPIAALLADLRRRGMLDETLVLWTGEFGRQPEVQILGGKSDDGRDHNPKGYCAWLAGGGIRAGHSHGATDELGYEAVENPVHLHDLHATILHLLGLDHTRLTYRYSGRDFRLTDVHGQVIHDIVA